MLLLLTLLLLYLLYLLLLLALPRKPLLVWSVPYQLSLLLLLLLLLLLHGRALLTLRREVNLACGSPIIRAARRAGVSPRQRLRPRLRLPMKNRAQMQRHAPKGGVGGRRVNCRLVARRGAHVGLFVRNLQCLICSRSALFRWAACQMSRIRRTLQAEGSVGSSNAQLTVGVSNVCVLMHLRTDTDRHTFIPIIHAAKKDSIKSITGPAGWRCEDFPEPVDTIREVLASHHGNQAHRT